MESFKSLLIEASAEELYSKFYSNVEQDIFDKLYKADPFSSENKFGPYSRWILNLYKKLDKKYQENFMEDLVILSDTLKLYDKAKPKLDKKDINQFKNPTELYSYLQSQKIKDTKDVQTKGDRKRDIKKEAEKAYEDSEWIIVIPKTHRASKIYGAGSQWCTAGKDEFETFKDYTEDGPLYIIISKTKKDKEGRAIKYQFHFQRNEYVNNENEEIAGYNSSSLKKLNNFILNKISPGVFKFFNKLYYLAHPESISYHVSRMSPSDLQTGDFDLRDKGLKSLHGSPEIILKDFDVEENSLITLEGGPKRVEKEDYAAGVNKLKSLTGAPEYVGRDFYVSFNKLTSLAGGPKYVGRDYYCDNNSLTSLVGSPETVRGSFRCNDNKLKSLDGAPKVIGKVFSCSENNLKSLKGGPAEVGQSYNCRHNNLTSLEGSPEVIKGDFLCSKNKLKSLNGSPKKVKGNFMCSYNQLTSLEGCPKFVGGDFICRDNKVKFTRRQVQAVCNVGGKILV